MAESATRVMLSYAHEGVEHEAAVEQLQQLLVAEGFDVRIDIDADHRPVHWPEWMANELESTDFVLVIASPAYHRRSSSRSVSNEEKILEVLLDDASAFGRVGLVIDQPGSIAQLAIAVAARRRIPVAYVPGLVMRRAAELYPGEAKTDRRDAFVIADTARTRRKRIHWLDTTSDELLAQLRVLNGFDVDLAADWTRVSNRLRDLLVSISPALERAGTERVRFFTRSDVTGSFGTSSPASQRHRSMCA